MVPVSGRSRLAFASDQDVIEMNHKAILRDIAAIRSDATTADIDHAAHIITELLELLVESNQSGFTLAEIEGDASCSTGPANRSGYSSSSSNASRCSRSFTSG